VTSLPSIAMSTKVTVALGRVVFRTSSQRPPRQLAPAERWEILFFGES